MRFKPFAIFFISIVFVLIISTSKASEEDDEEDRCLNENDLNFSKCKLPPPFGGQSSNELTEKNCVLTLEFLNCMNSLINKLCPNFTQIENQASLLFKMKKALAQYNVTYEKNCHEEKKFNSVQIPILNFDLKPKEPLMTNVNKANSSVSIRELKSPVVLPTSSSVFNNIQPRVVQNNPSQANQSSNVKFGVLDSECDPNLKCDSRSLHITCGYPLANPNSNLNAYCNELKHYIKCASCKIHNCKAEGSILSIRKHLTNLEGSYYDKCSSVHSLLQTTTLKTPSVETFTTQSFFSTSFQKPNATTKPLVNEIKTNQFFSVTDSTTNQSNIVSLEQSSSTNMNTKSTPKYVSFSWAPTTIRKEIDNSFSTIFSSTSSEYSTLSTKSSSSTTIQTTTSSTIPTSTSSSTTSTTTVTTTSTTTSTPPTPATTTTTTFVSSTKPETTTQLLNTQFKSKKSTQTETAFFSTTTRPETSFDIFSNMQTSNEPYEQKESDIEFSRPEYVDFTSKFVEDTDYFQTEEITATSTIKPNVQDHFEIDTDSFMKFRTKPEETSNQIAINSAYQANDKLDQLFIDFDNIDRKRNMIQVATSLNNLQFDMRIFNRTDVFKGVRNGAIYLHSKTNFMLNLNQHSSDFCLTSQRLNSACTNGWTVSFWIKISNLNLFDKTILKVDNLNTNRVDFNSKFFLIKLTNFDLRVQFLYKRKLWTISQNVLWKSEWTLLTLTWSEYDGITLYINDKKLLCHQLYDYYSMRDDLTRRDDFLVSSARKPSDVYNEATDTYSKRSFGNDLQSGVIYIGLNNQLNRFGRKFFWNYESSNQNVLLASTFSEAILLDQMLLVNHRLSSKEIMESFFKEYSIQNYFDSVEDSMFMTTTDNKQVEIVPLNGAIVKKFKESWYLSLTGDKQFVIVPNLFDSCIIDAENLCTFGFTAIMWIKFTYNFVQYPIEKNFEQVIYFVGAQDFSTGIEAILNIYPSSMNSMHTNKPEYNYVITINYKSYRYMITKYFKIDIDDISELNDLNCITLQFTDPKNITSSLKLSWMNKHVQEVRNLYANKMMNDKADTNPRSFSPYSLSNLGDYGIKASVLSASNSIGLIGDIAKQSYFNIKYFQLKNYVTLDDQIQYDFYSQNPIKYEFSSLEKLFKKPNLNIIGSPQIVDTKYGKSLLFSKSDQKVIINNAGSSCFYDLNECKYGYTLKLWVCFTNYNNLVRMKNKNSNSKDDFVTNKDSFNKNVSKRIHILTNAGQKFNRKGLSIIYDLEKSQLVVYAKTLNKWYRADVNLKVKLYAWYIITLTWDESDGLRLYINNRLLDHTLGNNYTTTSVMNIKMSDFVIGKADYEFEEFTEQKQKNKNHPITSFLNSPFSNTNNNNNNENQNEDNLNIGKAFQANTNENSYQLNSNAENYYFEFIIHKLVQYDIRKYPDEIISKNLIVQEKKSAPLQPSMNWLWYTISGSFIVIGTLSLMILIVIVKKRTSNGYWSRENDLQNVNKLKKTNSKLCCSGNANEEDLIDATKSNFNLELKQCHLRNEMKLTSATAPGVNSADEYSTNSLYGTIDRLIVKKNTPASCSTSTQSAFMYTNNYNSITKDPKMRNATSYVIQGDDDLFDKSEIHF